MQYTVKENTSFRTLLLHKDTDLIKTTRTWRKE